MLKGIHILLVEDNVLNQKIGKYILQKQNALITTAANGKEAIEHIRQTHFDIILMDLYMPVMDGYETSRIIREDMKNPIPIIALTASLSAGDDGGYLSAGMNAIISKPFDAAILCGLIVRLIDECKK